MKKSLFYNSLILSGSLILGLSQYPIYQSIKDTTSWSTPPGFLITAIFNSGTLPFLILAIILLLVGILAGYIHIKD